MKIAVDHCESGHAAILAITSDTGVTFTIEVENDFLLEGADITISRGGRTIFEHTEPTKGA